MVRLFWLLLPFILVLLRVPPGSAMEKPKIKQSSCHGGSVEFSCCRRNATGLIEIVDDTNHSTIGSIHLKNCNTPFTNPEYNLFRPLKPNKPCTCINYTVEGITTEMSLLCKILIDSVHNETVPFTIKGCSNFNNNSTHNELSRNSQNSEIHCDNHCDTFCIMFIISFVINLVFIGVFVYVTKYVCRRRSEERTESLDCLDTLNGKT